MQGKYKELLVAITLALIYPAVITSMIIGYNGSFSIAEAQQERGNMQSTTCQDSTIKVLTNEGNIDEMALDDYLTCVLLGEVPTSFGDEALKAQAVVARTYTLRRQVTTGKHPEAPVCMDSNCCQGYRSIESFRAVGGTDEQIEKVREAVRDTTEKVLVYNDQLIDATYFSCSGGMTEDAVAVWGSDIPYLQAKPSPGEEKAEHYVDTTSFSVEEFKRLLQINEPDTTTWLGNIAYTDGGGVATIEIFGKQFKGTQVRQMLGLRSTAFAINVLGDNVIVTTKGFGHRVGMSQYGADAMATQGKTYEEILMYYYEGTEIKTYTGD